MNNTMLDIFAAISHKDYQDRRRRQTEGIACAKKAGAYRGRPKDTKRNDAIVAMLKREQTWESIRNATGCSNSHIARLARTIKKARGQHLMPIRPQHRRLFPIDWPQLTDLVRFERAKGCCEHCRRPHGRTVQHLGDGQWWCAETERWRDGRGRLVRLNTPPALMVVPVWTTRVFLAMAHLDNDPTSNDQQA